MQDDELDGPELINVQYLDKNNRNLVSVVAPSRLRTALQICLLLMVAVTAVAYPICLKSETLQGLYDRLNNPPVFRQLLPWISCGFSPLVLKESLFLTLTAALLFIYSWLKIRGQWLGLERPSFSSGGRGLRGWMLKPEVWGFAFLAYLAASVAWSPVFQQSLSTWMLCAAGITVMVLCRAEAASASFAVKFMVLCVGCGVLLATVALLQHVDSMPVLPKADDPRNRMSSLIGHNTGLSSWLMFPLSFSLYFLLSNRRLWVRLVCTAAAALFAFVIIAAQSRAIWVLGLGICVILPWRILRTHQRRLRFTWILVAAAVIMALVAGLSLSPQTNPFARLPVSLADRVSDHILNLDQLRRETRLRILVVSLVELFPKDPLFGSGLGSFAWQYPKAQGDYFSTHPNSWLGTTTRRTDLAHNEYLQVLIETGVVGFLLLAAGLFTLARESWQSYRRFTSPYVRSLWWSLILPAMAVALHALVDFPLHVVPIALVTTVAAALSTRLGPGPTDSALFLESAPTPRSIRKANLAGLVATLVIFSWLPFGWQALAGRTLMSDVYFNMGQAWLAEYTESDGQTVPYRMAMLDRARRSFREAVVANVFNGEAYEGQATAHINRAGLGLHAYQLQDDRNSTGAFAMRSSIISDAQSAIQVTENQLEAGGLRYHYTWYLLGRASRILWELEKETTPPEDSEAYKNAVKWLRMSLYYNPADSTSLSELSDLLSDSATTIEESNALRDQLFELDPWAADELVLQPAIKLAAVGELETATNMLESVIADLPDHPRVLLAGAWLHFYRAVWPPQAIDALGREEEYLAWRKEQLAPGWELVNELPGSSFYRPRRQQLHLLYLAASGEIKKANELASQILHKDIWNREARAIYYWTQHRLFGGALKYEDSLEYYRTRALLTLYFMDDRETAAMNLGELAFREGQKLTLPEARRLVTFAVANDWTGFLQKVLPQIRKTYPGDSALARVEDQL